MNPGDLTPRELAWKTMSDLLEQLQGLSSRALSLGITNVEHGSLWFREWYVYTPEPEGGDEQ